MHTSIPAKNNKDTLTLSASFEKEKQGRELIAGFTQSMMKKPEQFALGHFPVYLEKGKGALVTDVDGNEYIDYICGLGANTLGHNHPAVNKAITDNLHKGLIHSLPGPIEIDTAQTLVDMIPEAQMVRFFKTGADANSAAVRLARYITGKERIITVGYNGWHDQYQFDTPGVPDTIKELTQRMPLFTPADEQPILDTINNPESNLAAVVLSVPYNRTLTGDFLSQVRTACTENNVLLVMDEVVTGFRLALGGAQEFFGIAADLVTLSKGIAAGMPLSAVTGPRKHMEKMEALQVSTTFGGEMLSLEVCNATLKEYQNTDYIEHIRSLGLRLKEGVNKISAALHTPLNVVGYDAIPMFLFDKNPMEHAKIAEKFVAEMAKRGIIMRRDVNFICAVHTTEQIDFTILAVESSLKSMIENNVFAELNAEI